MNDPPEDERNATMASATTITLIHHDGDVGGSDARIRSVALTGEVRSERAKIAEAFAGLPAFDLAEESLDGVAVDASRLADAEIDVAIGFVNGVDVGGRLAADILVLRDEIRDLTRQGRTVIAFVTVE